MSQTNEIEQHILELEEQRVQAFLNADTAVLERIRSDDLTLIHTGSSMDSKKSFIKMLETGSLTYQFIVTEDIQVRVYSDAAVVTGKIDMQNTVRGTQRRYGCVLTGMYVQQDNRWQMVALQATRVPEG